MAMILEIKIAGLAALDGAVGQMGKLAGEAMRATGAIGKTTDAVGRAPKGPMARLQQAREQQFSALLRGTPAELFDAEAAVARAQKAADRARRQVSGADALPKAPQPAPPPRDPLGPMGRLGQADDGLQKALRNGDPSQIFDARVRQARAQKSFDQAQKLVNPPKPPGFAEKLTNVFQSSRFAAGPLMPLAGQAMKLFGLSGPVGLAVTAGAAAVSVFAEQVKASAESLGQFRSAVLTAGGGNAGGVAGLAAMGIGPGAAGGMAAEFNAARQTGWGAMAAGPVLPGPLGPRDQAAELEKFIKTTAKLATFEQRFDKARNMGMPHLIESIELYRRHAASIEKDAAALRAINDEKGTQAAADFNDQLRRTSQNFGAIRDAIGKSYLPDLSKGLGFLADKSRDLALWLNKSGMVAEGLGRILGSTFGGIPNWIYLIGKLFGKSTDGADPQTQATKDNTDALNRLHDVWAQGIYGKGAAAARTMLPQNLRGHTLNRSLRANAIRLGFFGS